MKYPKEYLDEIKLRLKVSQVVGKTVQLKKRGKEFVGLSPFKNEKSPSFTVNDEKEFYHCFSSSEHGNIFDFLMKIKSIGFLKNKAKTLEDIWNNAQYIINDKIEVGADDKKLIDDLSKKVINDFINEFEKLSSPSREILEPVIKSLIDKHKTNFKGVGQPLRIALVGSRFGPGLYDVILSLDKTEVIKRLKSF